MLKPGSIAFTVSLLLLAVVPPASAQHAQLASLRTWVGEYPSEEGRDFLRLPQIGAPLSRLIGRNYYARLTNLQNEPYYLIQPIEYHEGHYVLDYVPNGRFNTEDDRVVVLIKDWDASMHVAVVRNGRTRWYHSNSRELPHRAVRSLGLQ